MCPRCWTFQLACNSALIDHWRCSFYLPGNVFSRGKPTCRDLRDTPFTEFMLFKISSNPPYCRNNAINQRFSKQQNLITYTCTAASFISCLTFTHFFLRGTTDMFSAISSVTSTTSLNTAYMSGMHHFTIRWLGRKPNMWLCFPHDWLIKLLNECLDLFQ